MPGCACFYLSTCLVSGSCVFASFFFLFHRCFHAYPWILLYHAVEANEGISISGINYCLPCRARSVGAKCNSSVWSLGESYISRSRTCGTKFLPALRHLTVLSKRFGRHIKSCSVPVGNHGSARDGTAWAQRPGDEAR